MTDPTPDQAAGRQRIAAYLAALAIRREHTGGWRDHLIAVERLPGDDERPLIAGDIAQAAADLKQAEAALAEARRQLAAARMATDALDGIADRIDATARSHAQELRRRAEQITAALAAPTTGD